MTVSGINPLAQFDWKSWLHHITGGYPMNATDHINRKWRHCRIGKVRPAKHLLVQQEKNDG